RRPEPVLRAQTGPLGPAAGDSAGSARRPELRRGATPQDRDYLPQSEGACRVGSAIAARPSTWQNVDTATFHFPSTKTATPAGTVSGLPPGSLTTLPLSSGV